MTSRNRRRKDRNQCHADFAISQKDAAVIVRNYREGPLYLRIESIFLHFSVISEDLLKKKLLLS